MFIELGDEKGGSDETDDDGIVWLNIKSFDRETTTKSCEIDWGEGDKETVMKNDLSGFNTMFDISYKYRDTGNKIVNVKCTNMKDLSSMASDSINVVFIDSTSVLLKVLAVPLKWESSQSEFENAVNVQSDFFIKGTQLKGCPERVSISKLNVVTENFKDFDCFSNRLFDIRDFVSGKGYNPNEYDIIVGFLDDKNNCGNTAGSSNGADTLFVTSGIENILAHEIGHIFGLEDQYCSNPAGSADNRCNDGGIAKYFYNGIPDKNPLSASLSCDPNGAPCCNFDDNHLCSKLNYHVCCYGNKNSLGGSSIMSYADAEGPRAFDQKEIEYLSKIPQLQC